MDRPLTVRYSEYETILSTVSEYETKSIYDQKLKYLCKKNINSNYSFHLISKKICHMTYKNKNRKKKVQSMAYFSL